MPSAAMNASAIMRQHLALIATDFPAWLGLLADDASISFPYAASLGLPERLDGKAAIAAYMASILAQTRDFHFSDIHIVQDTDPALACAFFHGEAVIHASGQPYRQDYVAQLETRHGKIHRYTQYWNPLAIAHAMQLLIHTALAFTPVQS